MNFYVTNLAHSWGNSSRSALLNLKLMKMGFTSCSMNRVSQMGLSKELKPSLPVKHPWFCLILNWCSILSLNAFLALDILTYRFCIFFTWLGLLERAFFFLFSKNFRSFFTHGFLLEKIIAVFDGTIIFAQKPMYDVSTSTWASISALASHNGGQSVHSKQPWSCEMDSSFQDLTSYIIFFPVWVSVYVIYHYIKTIYWL